MKWKLLIIIICLSIQCKNKESDIIRQNKLDLKTCAIHEKEIITSLQGISSNKSKITYQQTIEQLKEKKSKIQFDDANADSLRILFKKYLLNKIIPFWEDTPWTFEGHSSSPQEGSIACGYFVSTTLQHMGLKLKRYKLAQQTPYNEARSLAINSEVMTIESNTFLESKKQLEEILQDEIYFIGFDSSHVGFITKINGSIYIIHSNYLETQGVMIEPIEQSIVFQSYNKYYISELSSNFELLKYWINNKQINVFEN